MKKAAFSLVILTIILILTACSSNSPSPSSTGTTTAPVITPALTPSTSATTVPPATTTKPASIPASASPASSPSTSPLAAKSGGNLIITTGVLPDGIFGYMPDVVNGASVRIAGHTTEGLIEMWWDGSITPLLAESWDIPKDNSSITFHLRKGIKFTDGTDFNAQAVKWNFDAYIASKRIIAWKSVDVIDDYTVKVTFTTYSNTNLQTFADSSGWIVSPTAFQKNGRQYSDANPVSTAAFTLSNFSRDVSVTMTRNPNYWQTGKPYLDTIKYMFVTDPMTQFAFVQSGGADVWWTGTSKLASQAASAGFKNINYVGAVMCLIPDSANADSPWSNLKVRQAAEYAIDREAIAKALGSGFTQAAYQIAPRGSAEFDPNFASRKYDVTKAKQLLAEAGYTNGVKTSIIIQVSSNTSKDEVLAIQAYLKDAGIDAPIQTYETNQYMQYRNGKWKNGLLLEPIAAYGNYNGTLNMYFSPTTNVFQSLAKSDAWISAFNATMSSTYADTDLMRKAVKVIGDEAMVIPTSESITNWAIRPEVKVQDLNLLKRHSALYFNAENAWLGK
jgi:peptide/nickel transport system substrate-binding protein